MNGVADTVSHEVGHTLGLLHDGQGSEEYYYGANNWGPLMGGSGNNELSQWSKGEYVGATNQEDDLAIITKNGLSYRKDDHGNTINAATAIQVADNPVLATGVIERNTDVDVFSINLNESITRLTIGGLAGITNLDVRVKLYDAQKKLVKIYDPTDSLNVSIDTQNLNPGTYYLAVEGTGKKVNGVDIYSDYGSLGQYTITRNVNLLVDSYNDSLSPSEGMTLRKALTLAADGDTITFAPNLAGKTIKLVNNELDVHKAVTIDASKAPGLTVSGGKQSRVITVQGGSQELHTTIKGLTIADGYAEEGAGIYLDGYLNLENCKVVNNYATRNGGGIIVDGDSTLVMNGVTVSQNVVGDANETGTKRGGGILLYGAMTATNSIISNNEVLSAGQARGAGVSINSITWTINGVSTTYTGSMTATNSLIVQNTASGQSAYGGGIESGGVVNLSNCTVADNIARGKKTGSGGGVYVSKTLQAYNSIVATNVLEIAGAQSTSASADVNSGLNIVGSNNLSKFVKWSGTENYAYDATKPLFVAPYQDDYRLADNSQALDKGNGAFVTCFNDLGGNSRVQGSGVDLGAYEQEILELVGSVNVDVYNPTAKRASISWTAIPRAVKYNVMRSDNFGATWTLVEEGIKTTKANLSDVDVDAMTIIRVRAIDQTGACLEQYYERVFSTFTASVSKTNYVQGSPVTIRIPTIVAGTASTAAADTPNVSWYKRTANGDVEIKEARGLYSYVPNFDDCDLKIIVEGTGDAAGCDYEFILKKPVTVGSMTVVNYNLDAGTAIIRWDAIPDAATYTLSVSADGGRTWKNYASTTYRYKSVSGLEPGTTYFLKTTALDAAGASVDNYKERVFTPVALESNAAGFLIGSPINVQLANSTGTTEWFYVTPNGDVAIPEAKGALSYVPTTEEYSIKVVATGTEDSEGSYFELTFNKLELSNSNLGASVTSYSADTRQTTLTWEAIPDAASYAVRLSKDGGNTWVNYKTKLTQTEAIINGLYVGKEYCFQIVATNSAGKKLDTIHERRFTPISSTVSTTEYVVGEPIDVQVKGANAEPNSPVFIRWYLMESNGPTEIREAAGQYSYVPTTAGYDLKVVVECYGDKQGAGAEYIIKAAPVIGKTTLAKYNSGSRQAILQWDEIVGAKSYMLKISKDDGKTWLTYANTVSKNSAAVNGIYAGKSYQFKVLAKMPNGTFSESYNVGTIEPVQLVSNGKPYYLSKPKDIILQCTNPSNVDLRWYYVTDNGDVEIPEAHNLVSYKLPNGDYEIKIVAIGSGNSEGFSSTLNIPRPNKIAAVSNMTSSKATLTWPTLQGAVSYVVKRSADGGNSWVTAKKDIPLATCDVALPAVGNAYDYKILAYDANGKEMLSIATAKIDRTATNVLLDEAFADFFAGSLFDEL